MSYPAKEYADSIFEQIEKLMFEENISWQLALKIILHLEYFKAQKGSSKNYEPKSVSEFISRVRRVIELGNDQELMFEFSLVVETCLEGENARWDAKLADPDNPIFVIPGGGIVWLPSQESEEKSND